MELEFYNTKKYGFFIDISLDKNKKPKKESWNKYSYKYHLWIVIGYWAIVLLFCKHRANTVSGGFTVLLKDD